jgi:rhamnulokinase
MKAPDVLAFDLGAGSGRAFVGEWREEAGTGGPTIRMTEIHRFPNDMIRVRGRLHWDVLRLHHEMKQAIRKTFAAGFAPESFGIDTWGVDFGLLDAHGELAGHPYHYRDSQTEGAIPEVCGLIGRDELYRRSGLQFMPFNTIFQLHAMKKRGAPALGTARRLLLMPDLLMYLLTGHQACEWTIATTTQLIDPSTGAWNTDWMERIGVPPEWFSAPVPPGTPAGRLLPEIREELGGVPPMLGIAVASHDTESAAVAVPAVGGEFAYLSCGTWSLLGTELDRPLVTPETMALEFSNEGGAGGKFQLLKNIMGLWLLEECRREWTEAGEEAAYPELIAAAEEAEPLRSLIDPDDVRFYPPGRMTERIADYCRETGQPVPDTKGRFVRCVLESLALRYRETLESMEAVTGRSFRGLHIVGGGSRNALLCRLTARAIGRPVWAGPVEASALGNMLVQWMALGAIGGLAEARRLVAASFPVDAFEPDDSGNWSEAYDRYRKTVETTRRSV